MGFLDCLSVLSDVTFIIYLFNQIRDHHSASEMVIPEGQLVMARILLPTPLVLGEKGLLSSRRHEKQLLYSFLTPAKAPKH